MKKTKEINLEELLKVDLELDEKGKMYTKMSLEQMNNIADVMYELWESNKHLQEENKELKLLSMTQNNREYRSKFLKEYQKEHGEHCYPDYDEIYKRYDKLQQRIDKAIKYIHNHQPVFELSSKEQIQEWFEKEYYVELLNILQGDDNK